MGDCAGGAVLKKIAARFSFRGLRARKDTIAHATESHGVRRATVAVARRTGAQRACRACGATVEGGAESLRSKASMRLEGIQASNRGAFMGQLPSGRTPGQQFTLQANAMAA